MGYYEYLPHTADVRIKAVGKDLPDLLKFALKGLCRILSDKDSSNESEKIYETINLSSVDDTALVIDFLSETLMMMYKHKAIFSDVNIIRLLNHSIQAEIVGFAVDGFNEDIKAVTYHEAEISSINENELEIIITLDI